MTTARNPSRKLPVIENLFASRGTDGLVSSDQIVASIRETGAALGTANLANFFKDIIRTENANANWPESLKEQGWTARQRYGSRRVFQFIPYEAGQTVPFPDRYLPDETTQTHEVQSASMSFIARQLGRREETWLTQIAVNLRIIETQLSLFSPAQLRGLLRDVVHLQMSVKTQPEIDAVFLATYSRAANRLEAMNVLVTCEAKQLGERILEDQLREQVAKAMSITRPLQTPVIETVKPLALQVRRHPDTLEETIYVVEFEGVTRTQFDLQWAPTTADSERLYQMPLSAVAKTFYRVQPPIGGLNA